ncbi:MAG: hypothetical protein U0Q16_24890 [Bryobacteraceae bacterium]
MRPCLPALLIALASCSTPAYRLLRVGGQLRLVAPKEPAAKAVAPAEAHRRLYGPYAQNAWVDLQPGMVLKAVSPIVPEGEQLRNEVVSAKSLDVVVKSNVIGFATAYYGVERAGDRVRLRFRSAEKRVGGVAKPADAPRIVIDNRAAHWRLFFLVRESGNDRDITLVGSPNKVGLAQPDCADARFVCVKAEPGMAFAQVEIEYAGRRAAGTTVGDLRGAKARKAIPARPRVARRASRREGGFARRPEGYSAAEWRPRDAYPC